VKQKTKNLPDYDNRGRLRRFTETPGRKVKALFLDGVLKGQVIMVSADADYVTIGGFRYSYAGKHRRQPLYARVPKTWAARKALARLLYLTGKDPRASMAKERGVLRG
jgi:hypothetical protein